MHSTGRLAPVSVIDPQVLSGDGGAPMPGGRSQGSADALGQ